MTGNKIVPARDGFHHLVFVGLRADTAESLAALIAQLQSSIAAIVNESNRVLSCEFFGNQARFQDDLHFGFHAVFDAETGLDAVRQQRDHIALMTWFETVSNARRTEINAVVTNGFDQGAPRPPGHGLLTRP